MSQTTQIGRHATTVSTSDGYTRVTYHSTDVVKFNERLIILNSNGWRTHTTKTRMNQASNQFGLGFTVYQKDFDWFVAYKGETYSYNDGITLAR